MTILAIRNEKGREISAFSRTFSFDVLLRKYKTFFLLFSGLKNTFAAEITYFLCLQWKVKNFRPKPQNSGLLWLSMQLSLSFKKEANEFKTLLFQFIEYPVTQIWKSPKCKFCLQQEKHQFIKFFSVRCHHSPKINPERIICLQKLATTVFLTKKTWKRPWRPKMKCPPPNWLLFPQSLMKSCLRYTSK